MTDNRNAARMVRLCNCVRAFASPHEPDCAFDLTAFLLARIAEDEANVHMVRAGWPQLVRTPMPRALVECEAKRQIVAEAAGWLDRIDDRSTIRDRVLRVLALPYADHPDYRKEWKP